MIQYQEEFLDENNIDNNINILWGKVLPIFFHRKYLYDRYSRKTDKSDVVVALEYYISTIASGYFGGNEPQFKVKKPNETRKKILTKIFKKVFGDKNNADEYQTIIDYITDNNDNPLFFYNLVKDYVNTGACYGLVYENSENEIIYAHTSSLNTISIWDYGTPSKKIGLLRYWIEDTAKGGIETHIQIITKDYKKEYVDGIEKKQLTKNGKYEFKPNTQEEPEEVLWNDLPIFAVENPEGLALFENVISLIKKHEQVIKNNANIFDYNDNAKLKITGFTPTEDSLIQAVDKDGNPEEDENGLPVMIKNPARAKEDDAILNAKVFYTPDNTGDIDWVIKNINDTASENHKKTCLDLALMISGVPNVTDQGFTNADNSSALEKKFFPLDQVLQQASKLLKAEFKRMWSMITNRINVEKTKEYDARDIEITFVRNLPQNSGEIVTTWLKLRGLLSDKTVIDHLPYDLDAEAEIAEIDVQNEANIEKNLEQMQKMGQANTNNTEVDTKGQKNTQELTDPQKAQKLTADNKKEQEKDIKKQIKE